jgi:fructosamine-3-kinase
VMSSLEPAIRQTSSHSLSLPTNKQKFNKWRERWAKLFARQTISRLERVV